MGDGLVDGVRFGEGRCSDEWRRRRQYPGLACRSKRSCAADSAALHRRYHLDKNLVRHEMSCIKSGDDSRQSSSALRAGKVRR